MEIVAFNQVLFSDNLRVSGFLSSNEATVWLAPQSQFQGCALEHCNQLERDVCADQEANLCCTCSPHHVQRHASPLNDAVAPTLRRRVTLMKQGEDSMMANSMMKQGEDSMLF